MNRLNQVILMIIALTLSLASYAQDQEVETIVQENQNDSKELAETSQPVENQQTTEEQQPIKVSQPKKEKSTTKNGVLQLEDTIRGGREQPKVLSIVPWQPPRDKEQLPSPFVKRIEQDFQPLDRDEFRRRVTHFEKVSEK